MNQNSRYTISLRNITLGFPKRVLFEGVNVDLKCGELTALIGRNGTGKSTLLRTIMGLAHPQSGEITVDGTPLSRLSSKEVASLISFVSTEEVRVGNLKVYDVVAMGRAPYTNWIGTLLENDNEQIESALKLVGMADFAQKSVDTLSDGERQRVMIARSLAQDTPVILLDEPTAFLDLPNKYEICLLLRTLAHKHDKTIIYSTHDLNIALEISDRIVMINDGKFQHGTPSEMIEHGDVEALFKGSSIEFDREKGVIRLKTAKK